MNLENLPSLKDVSTLENVRVLVRVDFNVPIEDGKVVDDFRIRRTLPTVEYLVKKKAKVILIAHMSGNEVNSLRPVSEHLPTHLHTKFIEDYFNKESEKACQEMKGGEVILFENLRSHSGEKEESDSFARNLAALGDIYVNEAFASSHRKHASITKIPELLPSYAGLLFEDEVKNLSVALNPPHPFLFILGGAKFDTKIPLANKFSNIADNVVVAGALSNKFFEDKGIEIGNSLSSDKDFDVKDTKDNIILPQDVKVTDEKNLRTTKPGQVKANERIVDIGPETLETIRELAQKAEFILWNGPVGEYKEGFKESSLEIARMLSESKGITITGGGDTLSAISDIRVEEKFSFVSTAGGAMLEFLANGTLLGIKALTNSKA